MRITVSLLAAVALAGCSHAGAVQSASAGTAKCDAISIASPPGRDWWRHQRWRFASDAAAQAAYTTLVKGASPWPDWFAPSQTILAVGTRFQMAMSPSQTEDQPGQFGTFDDIENVQDVRRFLAVEVQWKPKVDHVVTYEVIKPLPAQTGPVGPQVDPTLCALLPGRWSQFQMMVPEPERMTYLRAIANKPIR